MCNGTTPTTYIQITRSGAQTADATVINERLISFYLNGQELATIMATPCQQIPHALGFMANEGIITSPAEISLATLNKAETCVDVWLTHSDYHHPRRIILTSGCGGGVTFDALESEFKPLDSDIAISPDSLHALMDKLNQAATLYSSAGGVHASAFSDGESLLLVAEDIGRHNTLDKLRGLAFQSELATRDLIILTSGRISSEMVSKARRMEIPIIASRTSPTSLSVELAQSRGITLIGYLRRNSMNIYTHPHRVSMEDTPYGKN